MRWTQQEECHKIHSCCNLTSLSFTGIKSNEMDRVSLSECAPELIEKGVIEFQTDHYIKVTSCAVGAIYLQLTARNTFDSVMLLFVLRLLSSFMFK